MIIDDLRQGVHLYGPLSISEIEADWPTLVIGGPIWRLRTTASWRWSRHGEILSSSGTPDQESELADLKGLSVVSVDNQSTVVVGDPAFRLDDGSVLEVFSERNLEPWTARLPDGTYVGEPGS